MFGLPGWGGIYADMYSPCLSSHDLSAKEEVGVCTPGTAKYRGSGIFDGPDWDSFDAYKGGALPDWTDVDPALTGKAVRVLPFGSDTRFK